MKTTDNDFLAAYKEFENELRNNSDFAAVKAYEDSLSDLEVQDRLRFARNMRNYLSHHTDGERLVTCNKELVDFINNQKLIVQRINGTAQDAYKTIAKSEYLIKLTKDCKTCKDLLSEMGKKKMVYAYILDDTGILLGQINIFTLIDIICSNPRQSVKNIPYEIADLEYIDKQTPLTILKSGYYLVTDAKGKIAGELIIK